jgi:hypothetical protein
MQDKLSALLVYGVLGLLLALSPLLIQKPGGNNTSVLRLPRVPPGYLASFIFAAYSGLLLYVNNAYIPSPYFYLVLALSLGAGLLHRESVCNALQGFSSILAAGTVSATLPWWRRLQPGIEVTGKELFLFAALLIIAVAGLLSVRPAKSVGRLESVILLGVYALAAAYFSFSLASLADPSVMISLWHHWGAYIDPAELVRAGARLFYDIPAQYGAGPTALLAAVCRADCWGGAYLVVAIVNFAFAILIGAMAWLVASGKRYRNIILLLLCTVTCTFWVSFPPHVSAPSVYPSTSGMRFLPVVMLAAWILFAAKQNFALRTIGGHLFWILGAFWSPESLFAVTAVWWPIYFLDSTAVNASRAKVGSLLSAFGRLAALAAGTAVVASVAYYLAYGVFPVPRYIFTYLLYPLGHPPFDPRGTIWYFACSMALAVGVCWVVWISTRDTTRFRRSLTLQLLAFAAFSYFIGRSHDNNLLNLLPFVMLVLLDALANATGIFTRQAAAFALASLLAWLPVFGWDSWKEGYRINQLTEFGFATTRSKFAYSNKSTAAILPLPNRVQIDQTIQLMEDIFRRGESFIVMDQLYLLQSKYPASPWSAIQGPTNFEFIPSPVRREFLLNTAKHFHRDGWLIISTNYDRSTWLADFDSVYDRTDRIDLESVYAIRFTPKH